MILRANPFLKRPEFSLTHLAADSDLFAPKNAHWLQLRTSNDAVSFRHRPACPSMLTGRSDRVGMRRSLGLVGVTREAREGLSAVEMHANEGCFPSAASEI
jgi:hypothetical protein